MKIQELFALPIGVKNIGNVWGVEFYTSDDLKEKFIHCIENSSYLKVLDNVKKLIDTEKLIPVFSSKNIASFFMKRIPLLFSGDVHTICGFYDQNTKKIFILIDNNTNFFGITPNDNIAELVVHELMHASCHENPASFLNLFKEELIKFYDILFDELYKTVLSKKETQKFVNNLCLRFELKQYNFKTLYDFYYLSMKGRTKLKDDDLKRSIENAILAFYYFYTESPKMFEDQYLRIHEYVKQTYKKAFDVDTRDKSCFQEITTPSEVIASISNKDFISSKVNRAIDNLK